MGKAFMAETKEVLSIVIPVFKNEEHVPELLLRVESLRAKLSQFCRVNFVIVVDGSPDRSEMLLESGLKKSNTEWKLVSLARNFGSWAAIETAIIEIYSTSSYIIVMSADLQEPENLVVNMAEILVGGSKSLVVGIRTSRSDGLLRDFYSNAAWRILKKFTNSRIPKNGVDIFGCNAQVAKYLVDMNEANSSLVGKLYWLGFEPEYIGYERVTRQGKSGWTLKKKFSYFANSIFAFTRVPILLIQSIGILGFIVSVSVSVFVGANWFLGNITVSGYTPVMLMLAFGFSMNLLALGILGSYMWRTFENVKARPRTVISRIIKND